jgi:hypothetical protein
MKDKWRACAREEDPVGGGLPICQAGWCGRGAAHPLGPAHQAPAHTSRPSSSLRPARCRRLCSLSPFSPTPPPVTAGLAACCHHPRPAAPSATPPFSNRHLRRSSTPPPPPSSNPSVLSNSGEVAGPQTLTLDRRRRAPPSTLRPAPPNPKFTGLLRRRCRCGIAGSISLWPSSPSPSTAYFHSTPIQLNRPVHIHPGVCGAAYAPPWVEYRNCRWR